MQQRIKTSNVVCNIIDYKFRYLDHGGADKRQAMTNRGEFYVWKKCDVSWRTIRKHWQENKYGAGFLYVSEKLGLNFSPPSIDVGTEEFTQTLCRQAEDVEFIRKFFGTCAYVSEKISHYPEHESEDDDDDPLFPAIPLSVEASRPQTRPLSPHDKDLMSRFEDEKADMRNDLRDPDTHLKSRKIELPIGYHPFVLKFFADFAIPPAVQSCASPVWQTDDDPKVRFGDHRHELPADRTSRPHSRP